MSKLVIGCGYLGRRVARLWQDEGETVYAVTRSAERAREWKGQGLEPIVGDVTRPETLEKLPAVETVLYAVGFDRAKYGSMRDVYVDGLAAALDALPAETGRIVYISSTSVYGPAGGEWVDERTPCEPNTEGGKVVLAAERTLEGHPLGRRAIVLRLAGIYGPDRLPLAAKLRAGEPLQADPEGWLNLIHVDDAARAVLAAERMPLPPDRFVVCDGQPVLRRDFYGEVARLMGVAAPTFEPRPADAPPARGSGDKRLSNRRMVKELQCRPVYADYRLGLAAIFSPHEPPPEA